MGDRCNKPPFLYSLQIPQDGKLAFLSVLQQERTVGYSLFIPLVLFLRTQSVELKN